MLKQFEKITRKNHYRSLLIEKDNDIEISFQYKVYPL